MNNCSEIILYFTATYAWSRKDCRDVVTMRCNNAWSYWSIVVSDAWRLTRRCLPFACINMQTKKKPSEINLNIFLNKYHFRQKNSNILTVNVFNRIERNEWFSAHNGIQFMALLAFKNYVKREFLFTRRFLNNVGDFSDLTIKAVRTLNESWLLEIKSMDKEWSFKQFFVCSYSRYPRTSKVPLKIFKQSIVLVTNQGNGAYSNSWINKDPEIAVRFLNSLKKFAISLTATTI